MRQIQLSEDDKRRIQNINRKLRVKYFMDKCLAVLMLLFFAPVMFFLALMICLENLFIPKHAGPVFVTEPRVSQGQIFHMLKLRTVPMKVIKWLREKPESRSISTTRRGRTHTGKWILAWYLDEIPQYWHVLKGEMSFIGPRPKPLDSYREGLRKGLFHRTYLRGGILGIPQACKKNKRYKVIFQKKAGRTASPAKNFSEAMDVFYLKTIEEKSLLQILRLDLIIFWLSLGTVFAGEHKWGLPVFWRKLKRNILSREHEKKSGN